MSSEACLSDSVELRHGSEHLNSNLHSWHLAVRRKSMQG